MKKLKLIISLVLFIVLVSSAFAIMEGIPNQFYGKITVNGNAAPDGVRVDAVVNGVKFSTTTKDGKYGYSAPLFYVLADNPDTTESEGGVNGDTIEFYLNNVLAGTHGFENGAIEELNLLASGVDLGDSSEGNTGGGSSSGTTQPVPAETPSTQGTESSEEESAETEQTDNPETPPPAPNEEPKLESEEGLEGITGAVVNSSGGAGKMNGVIVIFGIVIVGLCLYLGINKFKKK